MKSSTKPKSTTSYKDTRFGILPRDRVIELEKEGGKEDLSFFLVMFPKIININCPFNGKK